MFIGDFEKAAPWNSSSIKGCKRFIDRVWSLKDICTGGEGFRPELEADMHRTIKKVTGDVDALKGNTAIAAMMTLLNRIYDTGKVTKGEYKALLVLLNPFAPHVTEEAWETMGFGGVVTSQKWPGYDESKCLDDTVEIVAQINGKVKAKFVVSTDIDADEAIALAKAQEKIADALAGATIIKEFYVKGKLVNLVVR